jgi:arylsulfatase
MEDQDNLTTLYTENAIEFIERKKDQPFFIYLAHSMGHVPLGVSKKFKGKSEQGLYGDVVMELDWSLGQIEETLERLNLSDNTILIFTSDNGPWLNYGNHAGSAGGLREGKMTSWEGGQRVPFLVKWPKVIPKGLVCNRLASAIDLLPTFASITSGKLSKNEIDGVDISSLFKGNFEEEPRESMLYYFRQNNLNAVRKGNWKLVLPHTSDCYHTTPGHDGLGGKKLTKIIEKPELYNMMRDPGEHYNIIAQHPDKVNEMMVLVEQARRELGDTNVGIEKGTGNRALGKL